jgi:hypothetical protein
VISWAVSDGREHEGDRVVPSASTIKPIVASAFWRSGLDPAERVHVPEVPWSLADKLAAPTLGDCALLMLTSSDNAATNVLLERLGFDTVNEEARRLGCERTEIRRFMISDGPENLTCARDLVRMIVALRDEPRIVDALTLTQGSELPLRLDGRHVAVKGGELWPRACHEVALVDRTLGVAVCSAPAALPGEIAAVAEQLVSDARVE